MQFACCGTTVARIFIHNKCASSRQTANLCNSRSGECDLRLRYLPPLSSCSLPPAKSGLATRPRLARRLLCDLHARPGSVRMGRHATNPQKPRRNLGATISTDPESVTTKGECSLLLISLCALMRFDYGLRLKSAHVAQNPTGSRSVCATKVGVLTQYSLNAADTLTRLHLALSQTPPASLRSGRRNWAAVSESSPRSPIAISTKSSLLPLVWWVLM